MCHSDDDGGRAVAVDGAGGSGSEALTRYANPMNINVLCVRFIRLKLISHCLCIASLCIECMAHQTHDTLMAVTH